MAHEKELTLARDRLNAERRALALGQGRQKDYVFDTPGAWPTLGRSVQKAAASSWSSISCSRRTGNEGCKSCSFWADGFERMTPHLAAARHPRWWRISRAPLSKLEAFQARMGWIF